MNKKNYCIIMAGGSGTSLWPLGRVSFPKQFINIPWMNTSLLRSTFERFKTVVPQENIIIITLRKYENMVREHFPELSSENFLFEPYSRKTAPCVAYATYAVLKRDPDAVLVVTPCDHTVSSDEQFAQTIDEAIDFASKSDKLVTIGVRPDRPSTDFGYIQARGGRMRIDSPEPLPVKTFLEKPGLELAKRFVESGEFLWNTGVFVTKASVIRDEMEKYIPEITSLFKGWEDVMGTSEEEGFVEKIYTDCSNQSIDYGVMEKTDRAMVYPAKFTWNDISSWNSLHELSSPIMDASGNLNNFDARLSQDCSNNIILSKGTNRMIAVKGLSNYVVIDTEDALLICPKDDKSFDDLLSGLAMPGYEKYR